MEVTEDRIKAEFVGIKNQLRTDIMTGKLVPDFGIATQQERNELSLPKKVAYFIEGAEKELIRRLENKDIPEEKFRKIIELVDEASRLYCRGYTKKAQETLKKAYDLVLKSQTV